MSEAALTRQSLFSTLVKAADGDTGLASNVHAHEEEFATAMEGLPCPYPPEPLVRLYERSSALRPCVEAMSTNVHAFGHRLVPRVDLTAPDADKRIADILLSNRLWNGDDDPAEPTEVEVAAKRAEIERGTRIERIRLENFFKNVSPLGWTALRMMLSIDLEVTGNAYLEVLRNGAGRVARMNHCPAVNMRLRPLEAKHVPIVERVWVSEVDFELEEVPMKPRAFVQRVNAARVFFKAFGDPRVMGASDGKIYDRVEDMPASEREATEILHFSVFSGRTSYGVPRWIGAVFEVLGIEAMSQVNYLGFDNKGIPPLAISVSGGTLTDDSAAFLENYMKTRIKGRQNYHSVLLLEAIPTDSEGKTSVQTRIAIQPLAQPQDAVFLEYADRSEDIVARQWRISPITRGKTKDFNKSTSEAAMKKDEEQVFQPARRSFDEIIERTILRDLGVRYHRVESNSPVASDPEALTKILDILVSRNIIDPNEARRVASNIMNEHFQERKEDWAKQPAAFTLAGFPVQNVEELDQPTQAKVAEAASTLQRVIALRELTRQSAQLRAGAAEKSARMADAEIVEEGDEEIDGEKVHVVRVRPETMKRWVKPHPVAEAA